MATSRFNHGSRSRPSVPAACQRCPAALYNNKTGALEAVAGPAVRARVKFQRDERVANIVANWPKGAKALRAPRLGLQPDANFQDVIRQYIDDCKAAGLEKTALKGM